MFSLVIVLLSALLFGNQLAFSGEPSAPPAPSEEKQPSPEPIPLAEIPAEAETSLSRIRDTQNDLAADRTSENVARQIPVLTREIDARMRETRNIVGQRPAVEILGTLQAEWRRLSREVAAFNSELSGRATDLERDLDEIDQLQRM